MTIRKFISQLRCEIMFATKAQRHEVKKMLRIFPLWLNGLVAEVIFLAKQ